MTLLDINLLFNIFEFELNALTRSIIS